MMNKSLTHGQAFTCEQVDNRIDFLNSLRDAFPTTMEAVDLKELLALEKLVEESKSDDIDGIFINDNYVEDFLWTFYDTYVTDELEMFLVDFKATEQSFRRQYRQYAFADEVYYLYDDRNYPKYYNENPVLAESK